MSGNLPIIVYFNGTFINRENGAHARFWEQLTWISENYANVTLYSFSDHPDCPWGAVEIERFHQLFPKVELALERRSRKLRTIRRLKNAAMALAPETTRELLTWRVRGATPVYEALVARGPHLLLVNYVDALTELNGVDVSRCIIETHDVKFLIYSKRYGKSLADLRVLGKFRSEAFLLGVAGGLIAIAAPEAAMFKLWYPTKPIFYIPKYPRAEAGPGPKDKIFKYDILFLGSEHHFNVEGIVDFIHGNDWSKEYSLAVAGRVCQVARVREAVAGRPNVELLGFVQDADALYASAKLVISPVDGTGLKIKVVDALSAGVPVLASEHTMNGLPSGYDGCVFPLTREMAEKLIADPQALGKASARAIRYAATLSSAGHVEELRTFIDSKMFAHNPASEVQEERRPGAVTSQFSAMGVFEGRQTARSLRRAL
ncbi:MAG: glycosyltransferase family 4 protein [Caulobacteraceae bacterium]